MVTFMKALQFITLLIFVNVCLLFAASPQKVKLSYLPKTIYTSGFSLNNTQPENIEINKPLTKSKGKAFLLSLVVPGLGEHYAQASHKTKYFLASEALLWLSYGGFVTYKDWKEEDYRTYAASHAQVDLDGKSSSYFIDVGNYDNIDDYNAEQLRNRNLPKYYYDTETYYWNWENEAHRQKFDDLRIAADTAHNRSQFVIGAIIANHLISAIDAVWSVYKFNKTSQANIDCDIKFGDGIIQPHLNIQLTAHF